MAITFGGLATGLDTENLISELMKLERKPIERLQNDITFYQNRLKAFSDFDTKLKALETAFTAIDTKNEVRSYKTTQSSTEFFTSSATNSATQSNYDIEVVSLAQVKKMYGAEAADKTTHIFGTGTLSITPKTGDPAVNITINDSNNTLTGIRNAINNADAGVNASIINDGSNYLLLLTGDSAANDFTIDDSGLSASLNLSPSQSASQAHIKIDGIDIYSDNNTFSDAIEGISITVNKENATDETSALTVENNSTGIKTKIENFVSKYNDVVNFIAAQKDADWGRDSGFQSTKRHLQDLVVNKVNVSGSFNYLTELGITTNKKTGTLIINSTKLTDAITDDLDSVAKLFAGQTGVDGLATRYKDYLGGLTDSVNGIYASRKESTASTVRRLNSRIESTEKRLEQREANLNAQFDALEQISSQMNAQSSYLSQQLSTLSSLYGG